MFNMNIHYQEVQYNKEYREGFPRDFVHTASLGIQQTCRVRWIPTAEVCTKSRGKSRRYFLILSTDPHPLRSLNIWGKKSENMWKHVKTIGTNYLQIALRVDCNGLAPGTRRLIFNFVNIVGPLSNLSRNSKQGKWYIDHCESFYAFRITIPAVYNFFRLKLRIKDVSPHWHLCQSVTANTCVRHVSFLLQSRTFYSRGR